MCYILFEREEFLIFYNVIVIDTDISSCFLLITSSSSSIVIVDDELLKIVRIGQKKDNDTDTGSDNYESTNENIDELEFTTHVFSSVRFAPLVHHPKMKTIIPARVWNPSFHHLFPDSYQQSIMSLFLCSNSQYSQPLRPVLKRDYTNLAAILPRDVWIHIISFTNRRCT